MYVVPSFEEVAMLIVVVRRTCAIHRGILVGCVFGMSFPFVPGSAKSFCSRVEYHLDTPDDITGSRSLARPTLAPVKIG